MTNKEIYRICYNFHTRYEKPPASAEEWAAASAELAEIAASLNGSKFGGDLLVSIWSDIERKAAAAALHSIAERR